MRREISPIFRTYLFRLTLACTFARLLYALTLESVLRAYFARLLLRAHFDPLLPLYIPKRMQPYVIGMLRGQKHL